jgi:hypothetical protein
MKDLYGPVLVQQQEQELLAVIKSADRTSSEAGWVSADAMLKLLGLGWAERRIAEETGKSQSHVHFCVGAARDYQGNQRPLFSQAYREQKEPCDDPPATEGSKSPSATSTPAPSTNGKRAASHSNGRHVPQPAVPSTQALESLPDPEDEPEEAAPVDSTPAPDTSPSKRLLLRVVAQVRKLLEAVVKTHQPSDEEKAKQKVAKLLNDLDQAAGWYPDQPVKEKFKKKCDKCGTSIWIAVTENNAWLAVHESKGGDYDFEGDLLIGVPKGDGNFRNHRTRCSKSKEVF